MASSFTPVFTEELCASIKVVRPQKGDRLTRKTAETVLGNNDARVAFGCKKLEDEAA